MYTIIHNLAEIQAELEGYILQNDIYTNRYVSRFNLSYHQHLEQHTTSSSSSQYNRSVPCMDRTHYPSHPVPYVNSVSTVFNCKHDVQYSTGVHGVVTLSLEYTKCEEEEQELTNMIIPRRFNYNIV